MRKQSSFRSYQAVDLFLWAVILAVFELLVFTAGTRWFPGQPYIVSLTPVITAIVLVRWGAWAALHAVLGGLVLCFASHADPTRFAVYCIGNSFALLVLPFLRRWRKEEGLWRDSMKVLTFGLCVLLLTQAGRALVSLVLGAELSLVPGFFTTEVITDLFTLVVLWIVRRLDGVLEDQRHYLLRLREEEKKSRQF